MPATRVRQVELSPAHRSVLAAHQRPVERHQRQNVEGNQHDERRRNTVTVPHRQEIPRRPVRVQIRSESRLGITTMFIPDVR